MKNVTILALFSLFSGNVWATLLDLENLNELAKTSPAWSQIEAGTAAQMVQTHTIKTRFQPYGVAEVGYGESEEAPLFQFSPVFSPTRSASIGVQQRFRYGVDAKVQAFSTQLSSAAINLDRATRTGAKISLSLDLASNFLGRVDHAIASQAEISRELAKQYDDFNKNKFLMELRKLYWAQVSLQQSEQAAQALLGTAEKQLGETMRKSNVSVGDPGDVAQARALVGSRKNHLKLLKFQQAQLLKEVKKVLPSVTGVAQPNMDQSLGRALTCVDQIATSKEMPASTLTEVIKLLQTQQKHALSEAKASGDIDLKLFGEYQTNAVGTGFQESYDQFTQDGKPAYQVGLSMRVPLGGESRRLEKAKVQVAQEQYGSELRTLSQNLIETHDAAKISIELLKEALVDQKQVSENLGRSLQSVQRKFRQARVTLRDYITEEDKVFAAQLDGIEITQQIINEILNYSQVFDQFRCEFIR